MLFSFETLEVQGNLESLNPVKLLIDLVCYLIYITQRYCISGIMKTHKFYDKAMDFLSTVRYMPNLPAVVSSVLLLSTEDISIGNFTRMDLSE